MALEIKENEILANHSTFKIGGPARYFAVVKSKEEILEALDFAKEKEVPFFVLGGGSNVLFNDQDYDGVIIKIENCELKIENLSVNAGAGLSFAQLISKSIENGLSGLEWGIGIPGTIGGCVVGNCGAFGYAIAESVKSVSILNKEGEIKKYSNHECGFGYRGSRFKNPPAGEKEIILEIELKLQKGDKEKSKEEIKDILIKRKDRISSYPSVGCIFKNPKSLSAKSLIEQCGLKGVKIGGAQIAEQHANFIVNTGNATAKDVLELINLCKQKVKEKFNIDLEEEIVVV